MDGFSFLPTFDFSFLDDFEVSDEEMLNLVTAGETPEEEQVTQNLTKIQNNAETRETRFALLTEEDLTAIVSDAEAKGTKKNTKWIINTIEGQYI